MDALVDGIEDYQRQGREECQKRYGHLAHGQSPHTLVLTCADSRVDPHLVLGAEPNDLFVVRNVGNLVPPDPGQGEAARDAALGAALEYALHELDVEAVAVLGHSDCGAMAALADDGSGTAPPHLEAWLRHGEATTEQVNGASEPRSGVGRQDALSQANVGVQVDRLLAFPEIRRRADDGDLDIVGLWLDLKSFGVHRLTDDGFVPVG